MIILNAHIHLKLLSAKLCSFYKIQSMERNGSCPFLAISLLSRFFCAILTNRSSFFQRIYHALFIHSHELTHSPLIQSYSVCSPLSLSPSLPEGFSEAGTHDSHSLPFANPHTHIDRLFIHFPPSQTHSQHTHRVHTFRLDTTKLRTPHTLNSRNN